MCADNQTLQRIILTKYNLLNTILKPNSNSDTFSVTKVRLLMRFEISGFLCRCNHNLCSVPDWKVILTIQLTSSALILQKRTMTNYRYRFWKPMRIEAIWLHGRNIILLYRKCSEWMCKTICKNTYCRIRIIMQ